MPGNESSPYTLSMEVRDYECDMEGIVNNAVYQNYLEHARHRFLKEVGVDFAELTRAGIHPVVVRAEIDYKRPLRSGDRFTVTVELERVSKLKFAFVQTILRDQGVNEGAGEPVVLARIIAAIMNTEGRPLVPERASEAFQRLL
ncbi:MAG: acyl-CoA thioesterase [Spirochaetales bacterium]